MQVPTITYIFKIKTMTSSFQKADSILESKEYIYIYIYIHTQKQIIKRDHDPNQ